MSTTNFPELIYCVKSADFQNAYRKRHDREKMSQAVIFAKNKSRKK